MGAFSDGLLGFALGAGQTLSDEYDNINEEKRLIRREERTEKRAIGAENRLEKRDLRSEARSDERVLATEDRAEGRLVEREGRANVESDRRAQVTDDFGAIAESRRLTNEKLKLDYAQKLGVKNVKDLNSVELGNLNKGTDPDLVRTQKEGQIDIGEKSVTEGIEIESAGAIEKEKLDLRFDDDERRREAGLPTSGSSNANLTIRTLTPTQVTSVIKDATKVELGETGEQYVADRKKEDIPTLTTSIRGGGEDSRDVVSSILNGGQGEGMNAGRNTIEDLHKELSHITIAGLSTEARDDALNKSRQVNTANVEDGTTKAVAMAKEIESKMIQAWSQVDNAGFIDRFARREGITKEEATKQYMEANQESLRQIMGLEEEDATKNVAYKRIWNIYKRPLNDLISGKMEGGMINDG